MFWIGIFVAILGPVVAYFMFRSTPGGEKFTIRESLHHGAGFILSVIGAFSLAVWAMVLFVSVMTGTWSTWISLHAVFYYGLVTAGVGATVRGLTSPQQ